MGELKSGMVIEKEVVVVKKKTWEVIRFGMKLVKNEGIMLKTIRRESYDYKYNIRMILFDICWIIIKSCLLDLKLIATS